MLAPSIHQGPHKAPLEWKPVPMAQVGSRAHGSRQSSSWFTIMDDKLLTKQQDQCIKQLNEYKQHSESQVKSLREG